DDSGPVDAGKRRRPGKHTSMRRRRDSLDAKTAFEWIDEEPAENVRANQRSSTEASEPKGRGIGVTLVVLALVGGGGYLAYRYLYQDRASTSLDPKQPVGGLVPGSVESVAPTPPAARPQGPDPAAVQAALERAREVLRGYLQSKSPRVQRVAAQALGRTGDPAAIEALATALAQAKVEAAGKLDLAYALARGGDKRGTDALVAALGSSRDDRLTAGRLLAQLGDRRAVAIVSYLDVSQNRLSVAEQLARISEPTSIKVLEAIRADPKTPSDAHARATIALGLAGKTEVTAELHELVNDAHFNVFAAEALAVLHDEAARPVLEKLLALSTLRVGAARGLRRLSPTLDPTPYLPDLLAALGKTADPEKKDTAQIEVAEAILLLAGPASWSEPL
ncbi:MAG: lyase domain protein repeat-containing protein, partial [Deltaproteobacteria bacterium]|nr:lyase domain protein repeat-containing protein [Deltaproteobacteria bacterium]